jgi:uncharacterized C2H2 Zn-finger protein
MMRKRPAVSLILSDCYNMKPEGRLGCEESIFWLFLLPHILQIACRSMDMHFRRAYTVICRYIVSVSERKDTPAAGSLDIRCEKCGMTFTTVQDKEEHVKLEHKEKKRPTGVG